jgi:hypothetical protein
MSGASPELSAVWSLPSRSSFWIDVGVTVTPGFAALKSAAVLSQNALPGPVVELCHSVISTGPPSSLPEPLPLQPVRARAPTSRAADPVRIFRAFMSFYLSLL